MKIRVKQKELGGAVKLLGRLLTKKSSNPVLTMMKLSMQEGKLTLEVNDLMTGGRITVKADGVEEERQVLVLGKTLVEAVGMWDQEETSFELEEEQMIARNGKDRVALPLGKADDFPAFPDSLEQGEEVEGEFLDKVKEEVVFAASGDLNRPQLTGILWKQEERKLKVVGTDGFRLSLLEVERAGKAVEEQVLIPAKMIGEAVLMMESQDEKKMKLSCDLEMKKVYFTGENWAYFANLIESAYPPYERIVPLEFKMEAEFEREELLRVLNKASVFARESSNVVRLEIEKGKANLTAKGVTGQYESELEVDFKGVETVQLAFNLKYLTEYLAVIKTETVWLGINESTKPVMLATQKGAELSYIVMPFKAHD